MKSCALWNLLAPFLCESPPRNVRGLPGVSDRKQCHTEVQVHTRRGSYGAEAAGTAEQTEQASQGSTWKYKRIKNHKRNGQCQRNAELFWPKIQVNCVSVNLRTAFPTAYRGICKEVWRRPWKLKVNLFPSYFQIFLPNLLLFFFLFSSHTLPFTTLIPHFPLLIMHLKEILSVCYVYSFAKSTLWGWGGEGWKERQILRSVL